MNTSLMLYQLSYQGSDESSLGFLRYTNFLIKFNHLYLGTGCVCFWEREGGGTPHMHGHKESNKDLNLKILTSEWDSNPRPHEY